MLVEGFKDRVEEETRAKKQLGKLERSGQVFRAMQGSVWLNAHLVGLRSFLPMWGSPRGRLSPTSGCFQSPSCSCSAPLPPWLKRLLPSQRKEKAPVLQWPLAGSFRAPSCYGSLQWLWLHCRLEPEEPKAPWLCSLMELIARGSQRFSLIARGQSPEPEAPSPSLSERGAVTTTTTAQCHQVASVSLAVVEAGTNPAPIWQKREVEWQNVDELCNNIICIGHVWHQLIPVILILIHQFLKIENNRVGWTVTEKRWHK